MAVANEIVRVTCRFKNQDSGDIVNVWHFRIVTAPSTDDNDVADELTTFLDTLYSNAAAAMTSKTDPYDIRFDIVAYSGGKETLVRNIRTDSWTLTTPPSSTGDGLPMMDAAVINFRTAYPKVFGRKYMGAISEGNQADGVLTGGAVTIWDALAADLIGGVAGAVGTYVTGVISPKVGPSFNYFASFVGYVVNAVMGTQRRRRKNRGS